MWDEYYFHLIVKEKWQYLSALDGRACVWFLYIPSSKLPALSMGPRTQFKSLPHA